MANIMRLKQLSNGNHANAYTWISLHIFSCSNTYVILRDLIAPIIDDLNSDGGIAMCFYILYGEGGPHIRLRVQVEEGNVAIRDALILRIEQYLKSNSSASSNEIIRQDGWYDNDTVHAIVYEPEVSRYGGPFAIEIAEHYFALSSYTILALIKDGNIMTYADSLRYSIVMNVIFTFVFSSGDVEQSICFFERIFAGRTGIFADRFVPVNQGFRRRYTGFYEEQKISINTLVSEVWDAISQGRTLGEHLSVWEKGLAEIGEELRCLVQRKQIDFLYCFDVDPLWSIYDSYVHMNNNRLGVEPIDEPLIAILISESLKRIKRNERNTVV